VITWRVPVAGLVLAVLLSVIGYAVFPRPPHAGSGVTIKLPHRNPANDASGAAAWVWPDGVPGWTPGQTIKGFRVSFLQPVEVQAAQLAAARNGIDAESVRVLESLRGNRQGVVAILAAQTLYETPARTCLAGLLLRDAPVTWVCPGPHSLSQQHVFVAAVRLDWPGSNDPVYLAGVARGDVRRVVLDGGVTGKQTLYDRGDSWGEFSTVQATRPGARLLVYGHGRLLETVRLDVPVGQQRILR
jgi:hypothetical protein